ncbi:MAG: hypothetical protein LBM96_08200 [Methanobrevibacter sp.]|jgi:hypothetical protein|nr:hypothetical protein [Candidatus Methanoflexus mossambicus]
MIKPICSWCGESDYIKQGFHTLKPRFENNQKVKIHLLRHYCKKSSRKFSTSSDVIKEIFKTFSLQ